MSDEKAWLEDHDEGWAAKYEIIGTSGKGKYKIGDEIWLICNVKNGDCPSNLADILHFCSDKGFGVQLKCVDDSCSVYADSDVYYAVSECA